MGEESSHPYHPYLQHHYTTSGSTSHSDHTDFRVPNSAWPTIGAIGVDVHNEVSPPFAERNQLDDDVVTFKHGSGLLVFF